MFTHEFCHIGIYDCIKIQIGVLHPAFGMSQHALRVAYTDLISGTSRNFSPGKPYLVGNLFVYV